MPNLSFDHQVKIDNLRILRAGAVYRTLKHEAIAECFRSDKAHTARFLNGLKNKPLSKLKFVKKV